MNIAERRRRATHIVTVATAQDDLIARPLPHNADVERSILGAVVLDNSALIPVLAKLGFADFFISQHQHIFKRMIHLHEVGDPIDTAILMESLSRIHQLEAAGGAPYISQLADGLPRVNNVEHYARIVKEKSVLRALIYAADKIQDNAFDATEDAEAILHTAESMLADVRAGAPGSRRLELFDSPEEMENAAPLSFAVEGFLQSDAATLIAGLSGQFKTWIATSLVKSLLDESTKLWNTFRIVKKAIRVVYLVPESARGPFKYRLETLGLMPYVLNGKLLVRTLSQGAAPPLQDRRILAAAEGADVFLDTAVRFMQGDENAAGDNARGLAADVFALLAAGARTVTAIAHSPKSFEKENYMTLENMVRGTGDIGATFASGWGVRELPGSIVHIQNIKPRDFEPCGPFQLAARPHLTEYGNFALHKAPGACGLLAAEMPDSMTRNRKPGGASVEAQRVKEKKLNLMRGWMQESPALSHKQIREKFAEHRLEVKEGTIRAYRWELSE